jgi:DNA-directed RNA polymerase subunit RPC12/RpoP
MAQWRLYECKKCGYKIQTEPSGCYGLMAGMFYNFKCSNCKRIVNMGIGGDGELPKCPYCHETSGLSTWNPIEGHCPVCDGEMEQSSPIITLAD